MLNSFGFPTTDTQKHQPFHELNLPLPFPRILSQPLSFSSSVFGIGKKKHLGEAGGKKGCQDKIT